MKKHGLSTGHLICLFLLLHIAAVGYAVTFLHPYYGSNDEFTLAAIASGAYGSYTQYFIYLHSAFGWILKCFYMLFPSVNCYTMVMYGLIFLSLSAIGCTWITRWKKIGTVMAVMLVLAGLSPLYVELQYTKTAAVVTAAGYVLLFIGGQKAEKWKKAFVQALGILLLLLGSWIRFQSFGMVSILAFGFWLARAVGVLKTREWKQFLVCDCLPCIIAFSCVFGSIAAENVLVYTPGSQEEHYREYDKARQRLLDYGVPEWDDYQAEYEALGLTRTDVINLEKWLIADYDRYTADTFNAIVAFRQDRPFQWEYLLDYLRILIMKPLFLLGAFGWLLWFAVSFRKKKDLPEYVVVFWPGIALLGVYLYFIKIYRVLPIVVTACLLMFVIFIWSAVQERIFEQWEDQLEGKRFAAAGMAGVILTAGLGVNMLIRPLGQPSLQQSEESVAFRNLYDTITKNKNVFYAFDPVSNTGVELGYSIFEKLPDDYLTNIFTLGGWETESPQIVDNLEKYDCRSLLTGLYTSDQAVLISDTMLEHIMLHLQDIYDGIFITYSKVNQIGNFNLYALNYKMSGLKQTDKYSGTLDRTYTAEADRYDVIEGTVDMTPEELEGKSVFLWMESVESGKRRMFQGTWQQQDEDGLYSMLYDTSLSDTSQFRFTIPKMDYPLDDRYEVNIVIRDRDKAVRIQTENHLYDTEAP
ncbi:hypothetical protein [Hominiventricola filiformis]|uniref:Uncharacterized protein n=1 Tax=Hominiventricola filiformis TaxID=2885352 RepID=A0AAE3AC68_9FIRM|nr:hypothetical protein [Hominiventricola filiformis]MCC2127140.1 hypothetical protein [Hominiventricola filiformis]